jgi:serine/threonine protein kinase
VKIADFGLARLNTNTMKKATLGKLRGTYSYCAPEIYFNSPFTCKSDVFSIGIILWEMVVRVIKGRYERPYSEFEELLFDFQIIVQTARGKRCTIPPSCPPSLKELIAQCWHEEPEQRPSSGDLIARLQQMQKEYRQNKSEWDWTILAKPAPPISAAAAAAVEKPLALSNSGGSSSNATVSTNA